MKKISFVLVCALAVMLLAGCTTVLPGGVGSGEMGGKVGESSAMLIFGLPMGDASIRTAAAFGGVTKVTSFDTKIFMVTPLYIKLTTIVTGE